MSELGEIFGEMREQKREKRARNRQSSAELLNNHGIAYEVKNGGAHLVVRVSDTTVDFWPGTGLWIVHGVPHRYRGVMKLLSYCNRVRRLTNYLEQKQ